MSSVKKHDSKLWRMIVRLSFILLAFIIYLAWQAWDIHRFGFSDSGQKADCAIVLGAAAWHNKPSPVFKERIRHGIELYKQKRIQKIILTGGYGKGAEFSESAVAKDFCLKEGIPETAILTEDKSKTTEDNMAEANKLMEKHQLQSALIVSDPWHLKRACAMAVANGIDAKPSATATSKYESQETRMNFLLRELYFLHHFYFFGE